MSEKLGGNFDWYPVLTADLYRALATMREFLAEHPDTCEETREIFARDITRCETEIERRKTETPEETFKRNKQTLDKSNTSF